MRYFLFSTYNPCNFSLIVYPDQRNEGTIGAIIVFLGFAVLSLWLIRVELYRGEYGRPFYSDWCTARRHELRTAYLEARRQLAQIAWRGAAFDESTEHWRSLLHVDNCVEEAHPGLMQCYVRQGKRSAALRQYRYAGKHYNMSWAFNPALLSRSSINTCSRHKAHDQWLLSSEGDSSLPLLREPGRACTPCSGKRGLGLPFGQLSGSFRYERVPGGSVPAF